MRGRDLLLWDASSERHRERYIRYVSCTESQRSVCILLDQGVKSNQSQLTWCLYSDLGPPRLQIGTTDLAFQAVFASQY